MSQKDLEALPLAAVLGTEVERRLRALKKLQKALNACQSAPDLTNIADWGTLAKTIADANLGDPAFGEALSAFRRDLEPQLTEIRGQARSRLLGELAAEASERKLAVKKIGENPLVVLIAPFLFEADFDTGTGSFVFGKEDLGFSVPLEAGAILDGRDKLLESLKAEALSSSDFFDATAAAYRMAATRLGVPEGERVDLVDLLVPLSAARQSPDTWRKLADRPLAPFPRYLLAFQLWLLRRDRALTKAGWRLDLGAATGGSTRNKRNVLFVPSTPTEGQYYASIRLVRSV